MQKYNGIVQKMKKKTNLVILFASVGYYAIAASIVQIIISLGYQTHDDSPITKSIVVLSFVIFIVGIYMFAIALLSMAFILLRNMIGDDRSLNILNSSPLRFILWKELQNGR